MGVKFCASADYYIQFANVMIISTVDLKYSGMSTFIKELLCVEVSVFHKLNVCVLIE